MQRVAFQDLVPVALVIGLLLPVPAAAQATPAPAAERVVPSNLRPLLVSRQSEMRLVQARYTLDRGTLIGNFLGGMRPAGGRGGVAPSPPASLSPGRIARLKRFDLDWQSALAALDAGKLSPAGKADFDSLSKTIQANLRRLDEEAAALAQLSPLLPFAPEIVQLVEARIRLDEIDAEKAAGILTRLARQVAQMTARVDAGLNGAANHDVLRVGKERATSTAAAADVLRSSLAEWFNFYNGYDPLFTWWMGVPYKRADAALQAYATLLRDKVAAADLSSPNVPMSAATPIPPAPAPRFESVPDLTELVALPQDEMTAIVQRFRAALGRGGRGGPTGSAPTGEGRGGPPAPVSTREGRGTESRGQAGQAPAGGAGEAPAPAPPRDRAFFQAWLSALKTLDFDALSRNAQVDYLFIRNTAEREIARQGTSLPANPPRKTDATGIPGAARGRQGLILDLQDELVPYTPEELIAIAEREFAWCEQEMKKASREMGLGDNWKQALEKVKEIHPPPGGQATVVRNLMLEAVDYLRAKDLLTVPGVAAESLHMIMMTPERQLVNPFFTGGTLISVSYPTDTMEYDARIQSMRGNNTPFSHATAFHEMIPGHNLVYYTGARYAGYRPSLAGNSPFYGEGWPLYWELLLYDLGFHDTPEKRVGALFWRMHRCARIVFSLKFHLGEWSPLECVDYLVDRVGFERDNATAEVRRSFQGGYAPLYQAAYLLGGLQLRALRREIVDSGLLTSKQFHDEILHQGSMPIALLRLVLNRQKLSRQTSIEWKFAG